MPSRNAAKGARRNVRDHVVFALNVKRREWRYFHVFEVEGKDSHKTCPDGCL